ncbi:MAG: hypothetical protein COX49_07175 [bacterium (Candidatus Stahlbacteria) CG23_combo_of_CG06-09_8_20_14_all_40_9]|nr:MAG: hypothetical protein COX49_07175 [bacterium (Candidatus Stahlbacteria) CG23_combo_of_CG06-09_8_20_14_all_40_9]
MNIAILSNSYGEDRSGAIIGEEIKKLCPNASVIGVPLISLGEEYKKRGIDVLFSSPPPPSGGFLLESPVGFVNDLVTSSRVPFSYIARLRRMRDKIDRVIVVGDIMLLLLGWFAFRKRMWFLAPCKSDYFSPHLGIEKKIMKRTTIEIFTHDELTANNLQHCGISAIFLGNPMMDELEKENLYNPPEDKSLIGILPGSRKEAYENIKKIGVVINKLTHSYPGLHFAIAVSNTIDKNRLRDSISGINAEIDLVKNAFVDVVTSSKLVISLSGTASEQTVGLGIPIISFVGTGPQTTFNRLKGQEKLLGGCLKFVKDFPDGVVKEIIKLLSNENLRQERGRIGIERMGPKGGAKRIAEKVLGDRRKV